MIWEVAASDEECRWEPGCRFLKIFRKTRFYALNSFDLTASGALTLNAVIYVIYPSKWMGDSLKNIHQRESYEAFQILEFRSFLLDARMKNV